MRLSRGRRLILVVAGPEVGVEEGGALVGGEGC